jgi:hypothetical protein
VLLSKDAIKEVEAMVNGGKNKRKEPTRWQKKKWKS